jgi:hypothetical protein
MYILLKILFLRLWKLKKRLFICWYRKIENSGQFCKLYLGFIIIIINFPIIWCLIGR